MDLLWKRLKGEFDMKHHIFNFRVINIENKDTNILKSNLLEINHLYLKFLKLINEDKEKAIDIHQSITEKYSHLQFTNALEFYSKKISNCKYKKNKKIIKTFESKYNYSCSLIVKKITNNSYKQKYLQYINTIYTSRKDNAEYIDYYNSFNASLIIHGKKIKITFLNIYDLMDLPISCFEKEKIYNLFSHKIKINEHKFKEYILESITKNAKTKNYFLIYMYQNGIKNDYISMATKVIEKSNILQKYITYKKRRLGIQDIFHLELFSCNYDYKQKFQFDLNKIPLIFSDFGNNYIQSVLEFLNKKLFINKNIQNKGLTITDLSGNGFILLQSFDNTAIDSVFILLHELGHLSYSFYSENKIVNTNDIIFSEIAAITNELILNDYLMNKKILYDNLYFLDSTLKILTKGIESFKLLNSIYNSKSINYFYIKDEYYKIITELYKNQLIIEEGNIDFIIDNFISNDIYYLRYMLALIISINIFINIKNHSNGINEYINFLKYSSLYYDIDEALKIVGIDLNEIITYERVIEYLYELMKYNDIKHN